MVRTRLPMPMMRHCPQSGTQSLAGAAALKEGPYAARGKLLRATRVGRGRYGDLPV